MISRCKSSGFEVVAARFTANVAMGGGLEIGSNPRFLSSHLRSACISPPKVYVFKASTLEWYI